MARSHLRKHLQTQSIQNTLLGIGGILVLIIVLFWFGPQLLIAFSLLLNRPSNSDVTKNKKEVMYIAPPLLSPLVEATNSATITVSGSTTTGETIKLYVNGKMTDKTSVKKDNSFTFSSVTLKKGSNELKAKAVTQDNKESNYSETITLAYLDKAPSLEVTFPQDGQTVNYSPITVTGKTDSGVKATVNDFWAISRDDGTFSYSYNIQSGENRLKIIATDAAGNKTEKELTIKRE